MRKELNEIIKEIKNLAELLLKLTQLAFHNVSVSVTAISALD